MDLKKTIKYILTSILLVILIVITCNYSISKNAKNKTFNTLNKVSKKKVGLVLGASKFTSNNRINLYYKYRVNAAFKLYKSGKVEFILVSGDNSRKGYDEPSDFKNDLIQLGVPEGKIFLDFAGFRTLDSVVRAKEIFGQTDIIIISQKFHNERAIYLAEHFGIKAIGYNAKDINGRYGLKTRAREYLARCKVFVDLLIGVKPKFLGKSIQIN